MSGSIRWFNYTSDNGQTYALSGDKSNIQAVNPSGAGTPERYRQWSSQEYQGEIRTVQ